MEYKEQKPDGTLGGAIKANYDLKEMTGRLAARIEST